MWLQNPRNNLPTLPYFLLLVKDKLYWIRNKWVIWHRNICSVAMELWTLICFIPQLVSQNERAPQKVETKEGGKKNKNRGEGMNRD